MQDIRAAIIARLSGLSVTHNSGTVTLSAAYWSQVATTPLPAVFVRSADVQAPILSIDGHAQGYDARYDLAIVCIGTDALLAESFLTDAANAIQTNLRAVQDSLGGAWMCHIDGDRTLPPETVEGTELYQRVLTFRAQSIETF